MDRIWKKPGAQGLKGDKEWMDFVTQPELLDIAAQLIGEDLVLWGTTNLWQARELRKADTVAPGR